MSEPAIAGDQVRVSVQVALEPAAAFRLFTEEIDRWWRRGLKYRIAGARHGGARRGFIRLEAGVGGRLFESFETPEGTHVVETGRVTLWEPPTRLAFAWRAVNFAPTETTEVEVRFEPRAGGTFLTYRGWSRIRPDHPARHGLATAAFIRMLGLWWSDLLTALREAAAPIGAPVS